jgi:5-deoxy-5-amino-3-dehydroquinate synthase
VIIVEVPLDHDPYDVIVGDGARRRLADAIARLDEPPRHAAIVTEGRVGGQWWFSELDPGIPFGVYEISGGEPRKTLDAVLELCRAFSQSGLSRKDVVVAVGGGVVTDLAGFAAAVYLRGVRYVNVATSLLAQVDAAIGGKTGANLPEGKNLVGSFWQPSAVICDTETLSTLPEREILCGRGEMAKYALLGGTGSGASLLELPLAEQVARCAEMKARIVAEDEREGGRRAVLNYGHTLAHALEAIVLADPRSEGSDDGLRHGEAVAVGLVFAAHLARRLGRIDDQRVEQHRRVVEGYGLSPSLPPGLDPAQVVAYMSRDKKAHHDLTFVLDGPEGVEVVANVGPAEVMATLAEMGATP